MPESWFDDFVAQLKQDAIVLMRWGQSDLADALDGFVRQGEERREEWLLEGLTLDQASTESGYSTSHLRRLIRDNQIENVGDDRRLKVRRSDLPRKASSSPSKLTQGEPDLASQVLRARGLDIP